MAKGRKNNSKRREARPTSAPSRFFDQPFGLSNARRALKNPFLGGTQRATPRTQSYEPVNRLSSYLKNARATPVTYSPSTTKQKPKNYSQPNWSDVTQKNREQPDHTLCRQRDIRRQIMFATNNAGKTGQKSPVWTEQSRMTCRKK